MHKSNQKYTKVLAKYFLEFYPLKSDTLKLRLIAPTYLAELQRSKMTAEAAGISWHVLQAQIKPTHPTVPKQLGHEISSASMWLRTASASCTAGAQKSS